MFLSDSPNGTLQMKFGQQATLKDQNKHIYVTSRNGNPNLSTEAILAGCGKLQHFISMNATGSSDFPHAINLKFKNLDKNSRSQRPFSLRIVVIRAVGTRFKPLTAHSATFLLSKKISCSHSDLN